MATSGRGACAANRREGGVRSSASPARRLRRRGELEAPRRHEAGRLHDLRVLNHERDEAGDDREEPDAALPCLPTPHNTRPRAIAKASPAVRVGDVLVNRAVEDPGDHDARDEQQEGRTGCNDESDAFHRGHYPSPGRSCQGEAPERVGRGEVDRAYAVPSGRRVLISTTEPNVACIPCIVVDMSARFGRPSERSSSAIGCEPSIRSPPFRSE